MAGSFDEFGKTAQRLARNPLGIIALFIVLVYGIAGLTLGLAGNNLTEPERAPLIWFLVVFPVVVLIAFLWLVARHHMKLYAPHDFRSEEGFFRASPNVEKTSVKEQRSKLDEEAAEIVREGRRTLTSGPALPPLGKVDEREIRKTALLADDLMIRVIEQNTENAVARQMTYRLAGGEERRFDGLFDRDGEAVGIEVKYTPFPNQMLAIAKHYAQADLEKYGPNGLAMIFCIVSKGFDEGEISRISDEADHYVRTLGAPRSRLMIVVADLHDLERRLGVGPSEP